MSVHFQEYRQHVDALVEAVLAAANPETAVRRFLRRDGRLLTIGRHVHSLDHGRVFVVSVGKAAVPMARAAATVLGEAIFQGIVISKKGAGDWPAADFPAFIAFQAGHPVPDEDGIRATTAVLEMLDQAGENDLVLCLISGGTSALLTQPFISLADWQALTGALLASGCTINELNVVRRRLDGVKGGGLAQRAAPATCTSLILSDVVGNPLPAIGSGPTVMSVDTAADVLAILTRYDVQTRLETAVWQRILRALEETDDVTIVSGLHTENIIVGDVRMAAQAALARAVQLGFVSQILTAHLEGEAREVGRVAAAIAKDMSPGRCFILGGETTVTLRGDGLGGRNLEVALAAAVALDGQPARVIASFATDGEDGPTDAAGAVISGETARNGREHQLDPRAYLDRNDSYTFFSQLDAQGAGPALIQTGSTGTNVNDLLFLLTYP